MAIPKSKKLEREETKAIKCSDANILTASVNPPLKQLSQQDEIIIRPVECQNDFVAILQSQLETSIELAGDGQFKNEGIVVGVGPGMTNGAGGRLLPTVNIGDCVMFGRNVAATLEPDDGLYKNKKVIIISERNILCKLPTKIRWRLE